MFIPLEAHSVNQLIINQLMKELRRTLSHYRAHSIVERKQWVNEIRFVGMKRFPVAHSSVALLFP